MWNIWWTWDRWSAWPVFEQITSCINYKLCEPWQVTMFWGHFFLTCELVYYYLPPKTLKMFKWDYAWKVSDSTDYVHILCWVKVIHLGSLVEGGEATHPTLQYIQEHFLDSRAWLLWRKFTPIVLKGKVSKVHSTSTGTPLFAQGALY